MTRGHRLAALMPLLLGIVVLLVSLGALVLAVDKTPLLPPHFYQAWPYITEPSLQAWDWVSNVRVARAVLCASLTQWIMVSILLTAFWSFHQKRAPKFAGFFRSPQKLGLHIASILDGTNLAQNCPLNAKGPESTRLSNVPEATLKDNTGSDESARVDGLSSVTHNTKKFENITKPDTLPPIPPPNLHVFRMVQVETETIADFPTQTSNIASSRSTDEDMENRISGPFTNSHVHDLLETTNASPNPENRWRTVEAEPSLPILNQRWQQPTTTQQHVPEAHPTPLGSPLYPQQANGPIIGGVSGLLNDNISTVRSSRSMEVQRPARTVGRSRGELPESVQHGNGPLEHPHTILSDVSRNRIVNNVRSGGGYPQHIQHSYTSAPPTTALMSSIPDGSQGISPVTNARNQSYRPVFQPLTPALMRFTQAEQPWSPELQRPAASVRRAKLQDDFGRVDALFR